MNLLSVADLILGIARLVTKSIGMSLRDFGRFAATEPKAAAEALDLAAGELEARADARRRQYGWLARRHRAVASKLRAHADELRARA